MFKYLAVVGTGIVLSKMTGLASAKDNLKVNFSSIKKKSLNWSDARFTCYVLLSNQNNFTLEVHQLTGYLVWKTFRIPVQQDAWIGVPPKKTIRASFTLSLNFSDFFFQLKNLFDTRGFGTFSEFAFSGQVNGRANGINFSVPINQKIPLEL